MAEDAEGARARLARQGPLGQEGVGLREFRPDDRAGVAACIAELQNYERAIEADRHRGEAVADAYLRFLLAECDRRSGRIFVAETEGELVGFICCWPEREPNNLLTTLTDYLFVSDLAVRADHRRRGIGGTLMRRAEAFAAERGKSAIRVHVLAGNPAARSAYRKFGYREYDVGLLKRPGGEPRPGAP